VLLQPPLRPPVAAAAEPPAGSAAPKTQGYILEPTDALPWPQRDAQTQQTLVVPQKLSQIEACWAVGQPKSRELQRARHCNRAKRMCRYRCDASKQEACLNRARACTAIDVSATCHRDRSGLFAFEKRLESKTEFACNINLQQTACELLVATWTAAPSARP